MNSLVSAQAPNAGAQSDVPTIAIVIPARNEAAYVSQCLEALARQDYPAERIQIILSDNGSTDATVAIAQAHGVNVLLHPQGRVGAVRNSGARATNSQILAFVDADCVTRTDWLSAAVTALAAPGVGATGGGYLAHPHGTWVQRAWAPTEPGPTVEVAALPGGSIVVQRELFSALGGFDEQLSAGEDDDFCRRVRDRNLKVVAVQASCVIHLGYPRTLRAVARRQVWHGSYQLDVAETWREPQLLMTHSTALGLLTLLATPWLGAAAWAAAGLLLIPPILLMSITKAARRSDRLATLLRMVPVATAFYAGRALGLLKNYRRLALSGVPPQEKAGK